MTHDLAVVKIKILNMIGRMPVLEKAVDVLGKSCAFHPDNVLSFYSDTAGFSPISEENPYAESLHSMTEVLKSTDKKVAPMSVAAIDKIAPSVGDWKTYAKKAAQSFGEFNEKINESNQKIAVWRREIEKIGHFSGLDLDLMEIHKCQFIKFRFGFLPKDSYDKLGGLENPYLIFFPANSDEKGYWGMYCAPIDKIDEIDKIFSGLYFERTQFDAVTGTPEQNCAELNKKCADERTQIQEIKNQREQLWRQEEPKFCNVYAWLSERYTCFGIRRYAARYGNNFILTGWVPADREKDLRRQLDRLDAIKYTLDDGSDPDVLVHSPPVQLHNKKLFRPFEFFVDMYGMPDYDETDPTVLVAFTYVFFFGVMFADLGQGLCISLIGWLMWRKWHMKLGKALIPCGISSAFWGTLFGSVFGFEHALDPFYQHVFGLPGKPISVLEGPWTLRIIYSAVGVGILLLIVAILINIFTSLRRKLYTSGLFGPNGVAGLVFYGSVIFGLVEQTVQKKNVFTPAYVVFLIVLPLVLMYLQEILGALVSGDPGRMPKNLGDYFMQSFFELFESLLSYLTNTISFIRVGAFVLVHAGMMLVVFTLAESVPNVIGYAAILLIGNAFVIALEGLLVGIQSLRLDFYELFSRFFEGSGRPYTPVVVGQES